MNKRSHIHKKADSSASNPVLSQFQSRPFIAQAKPQSQKPLTQTQTENQEFQQQKFEATKLELQAKYGTITPEGQERLTVLQAKMSGLLQRRQEQASSNGSNFANIPISRNVSSASTAIIQKRASQWENRTGLPDNVKEGIENLSGYPMDDVRVHYNSAKPAQLNALAYTQGTEIHVAPGQKKHVPHEAWHVVQQKQGRVKPTMQAKGVAINDDTSLEREADVMGAKAVSGHAHELTHMVKQNGSGINNSASTGQLVQRTNGNDENQYKKAKEKLMASIGGKNPKECRNKLEQRFPDGPLFSTDEKKQIELMAQDKLTTEWLQSVGIGTSQEAQEYLTASNYKNWLKLEPGKRLLIATIAWDKEIGKNEDNPPPAYTLGRHMMIKTGGLNEQEKQSAEQQRDEHIRNSFINTLKERKLPADVNKDMNVEERGKNERNSAKASEILTKIFLILQSGLKIYDKEQKTHIDYRQGDVARALAHGGRVNIRIPQLKKNENYKELTDWIGITERREGKNSKHADPVYKRSFGTHHMNITKNKDEERGKFEEQGGMVASAKNVFSRHSKIYGLDLSAGGLGKKDFNGDIILPDGSHGHMFIGFTYPTNKEDGALQIGLETTAPGADSTVGYKHNMFSTEATANPESSVHGHKTDKIGGGSLKDNQRYVDLDSFEGKEYIVDFGSFEEGETSKEPWLKYLKDVEKDWIKCLEDNGSQAAYEELVGKRKYFGYNDNKELNKISYDLQEQEFTREILIRNFGEDNANAINKLAQSTKRKSPQQEYTDMDGQKWLFVEYDEGKEKYIMKKLEG